MFLLRRNGRPAALHLAPPGHDLFSGDPLTPGDSGLTGPLQSFLGVHGPDAGLCQLPGDLLGDDDGAVGIRKYRLTCPIRKPNPYRRLQRSIRMGSTAENLVNREFESRGPRAILLTDITYIPLNGKFCYLSTILDACTKQVLSYAVSESLEVDFVLEMVERLVQNYGTSLNKETVIHSDQGTHYTSLKFIQLVESRELRRSMSRRGNCWDNAPQESFFGHMKDELAGEIPGWTSFADAKASIDRWMDYYNQDRCQWDLAKLSPNEFYEYISTGEHPAGMLPQWVK